MKPSDTSGFQEAVAMANVIKASDQVPDHVNKYPSILPTSAAHHRKKKRTAATGAPQCRANFRTGSMPVTLSTAITQYFPIRCNLNPKAR